MTQLLFTRKHHLGSGILRIGAWSGWSHVQVLRGRVLWGASYPHGVGPEDFEMRVRLSSRAALVTINTPNPKAGDAFIGANEGKPYDLMGAIGLGLHREWEKPDAWWCSEYAAALLKAEGLQLFRDGSMRRVTQQDIFKLNFPVEYLK